MDYTKEETKELEAYLRAKGMHMPNREQRRKLAKAQKARRRGKVR